MKNTQHDVRFATSSDGVRIAYATSGSGPPLVKAANWLSHLEYDRRSPVWRHWLAELSRDRMLVRYDERGCGLSDRSIKGATFDAWVRDLETVVDALGLERFPLLGLSQGSAVAVAYAVRHPERVSHLVLHGGFARGRCRRTEDPDQLAQADVLRRLTRLGWGEPTSAFLQVFATLLIPEATTEQLHWLCDLQRVSATPEDAVAIRTIAQEIDVTRLAPNVACPTLILHAEHDAMVPLDEGRLLAALIPGARFVLLESRNHVLLEDEPAWIHFLTEVRRFLEMPVTAPPETFPDLTRREREVLDLMARGFDNTQIADHLFISPKTVRNHVTSIFAKLDVRDRGKAIVRARKAGLG